MFIGHFAVAFASKKAAPKASLGTFILSAQLLDYIWPVLVYFDVEHVRVVPGITAFNPLDLYDYPYSHSMLMALAYSVVFGLGYYVFKRYASGAIVAGICVFSHWVLDLVTHKPDLPLFPWTSKMVGLGLWNHYAASVTVESALYIAGVAVYLSVTKAKNRTGAIAFWALAVVLPLMWVGTMFAPPPVADHTAIGIGGVIMMLFIPWGYWVDRNRELTKG